jgi:hypothetical protein
MRVGAMFSPKTRGFFHEKGKQIIFLAHEKSEIFLQILPKYLVGNWMERFFIFGIFRVTLI